jgi:hypothetical protein
MTNARVWVKCFPIVCDGLKCWHSNKIILDSIINTYTQNLFMKEVVLDFEIWDV